MSDAIVTELRPSPAKGEGAPRPKGKDPTAALRAKRYRKRKSTVTVPDLRSQVRAGQRGMWCPPGYIRSTNFSVLSNHSGPNMCRLVSWRTPFGKIHFPVGLVM